MLATLFIRNVQNWYSPLRILYVYQFTSAYTEISCLGLCIPVLVLDNYVLCVRVINLYTERWSHTRYSRRSIRIFCNFCCCIIMNNYQLNAVNLPKHVHHVRCITISCSCYYSGILSCIHTLFLMIIYCFILLYTILFCFIYISLVLPTKYPLLVWLKNMHAVSCLLL